jgi:hypothetical protein
MTIRYPQGSFVLSRAGRNGRKGGADVWVQHGELELQISEARVRFPL